MSPSLSVALALLGATIVVMFAAMNSAAAAQRRTTDVVRVPDGPDATERRRDDRSSEPERYPTASDD